MAKDYILSIDNRALCYGGKVIPLRSIAYFEKYKVKKPYREFSGPLILLTAIVTALTAASDRRGSTFLVPLLGGVILWLLGITIIGARPRRYFLVLQTTAGDAPRLLETRDENFLD